MSGAFGQIVGTGMNIFTAANDRRTAKSEARAADERALRNSKELTLFNKAEGLDLWKKTGIAGQVAEWDKVGANRGLMYGGAGSGASGTTSMSTGSGQGTNPNMPESYKVSPTEIANMALLKAQKENIEADTDNKRADLPVKGEDARGRNIENNRREYAGKDGKTGIDVQREKEQAEIDWTKQSVSQMKNEMQARNENLEIEWKNAKTKEDQVKIYERIEQQKLDLELELFERGMNQRQIEYTVDKVFEGVDKVLQIRSGGASTIIDKMNWDDEGKRTESRQTIRKKY